MSWNYTGRPDQSNRDKVRFLIGDTCRDDQQVQDEEIAWALSDQSDNVELAAAKVLRAMAAEWSRVASVKVGDVAITNAAAIAKGLSERADELDPYGLAMGGVSLVIPRFGGLSISEKETLAEDSDAVQPSFSRGMFDNPEGPGDGLVSSTGSDSDLTS